METQQAYLDRLGLTRKVKTDLPEVAQPMVPKKWSELTSMTVAFGHGLATTPLSGGGRRRGADEWRQADPADLLPADAGGSRRARRAGGQPADQRHHALSFRLNVQKGSGKRAAVPGYLVGGKTGTAEKVENGRYSANKRLNSFLAAFPMDDPQYVVLVVLDEPKPEKPAAAVRRPAPMPRRRSPRSSAGRLPFSASSRG